MGYRISLLALSGLIFAWCLSGCGKSDSGASSGSSGQSSVMEQQAEAAVMAEIQKRWMKGPDGWTTAKTTGTSFAADHYLRQFRDLGVQSTGPFDLSESDKLNGIEWAGQVNFKKSPVREAGDPGIALDGMEGSINRGRGQWSQWIDFQPEPIQVQKVKGVWQVNTDTLLLRCKMPTPSDIANAGVK